MDLDDQLAALAAGELEPEEARAVRARVAADPALRQQLTRLERLDAVLASWDVPPMDEDDVARLDEAVTEALDALDDGPLVGDRGAVVGMRPRALPDDRRDDHAGGAVAASTDDAAVVDHPARRDRRGVPPWVAGLTVAAAAAAVVGGLGTGVLQMGGDDSDMEVADVAAEDGAEEADREIAERATTESLDPQGDTGGGEAATGQAPAFVGPVVETGLALTADDLDGLAERLLPPAGQDEGVATGPVDGADEGAPSSLVTLPPAARDCVDATATSDGGVLGAIALGTYEGVDVVVTVTVLPADEAATSETRVISLDDCTTLAVVEEPLRR